MAKNIVVFGYGPGVSNSVVEKFGSNGFNIALAARNADRLKEAEKALAARGWKAAGFPADLSSPGEAGSLVKKAREKFGPIDVVCWNTTATGAGDFLIADVDSLRKVFDLSVTSLVVAVQEALADLKAAQGAVLVTNGGFALIDPKVDAAVVQSNSMGLGLANAAKMKATRLLAEKLRPEGVYVGEVMIGGSVKGTAWDKGQATVNPKDVADLFWDLYTRRDRVSALIR